MGNYDDQLLLDYHTIINKEYCLDKIIALIIYVLNIIKKNLSKLINLVIHK